MARSATADRAGNAAELAPPHPCEAVQIFGHGRVQAAFEQKMREGRMPHAWILAGPKGIGKATLAWWMARRLLTWSAKEDANLIARRIRAGSEPRLFVLTRTFNAERGRLHNNITVDDVRQLRSFFALTAAEGGWRAVIVDAADDLNTHAANACLKTLEEPPPQSVLILVAHQPARLLPTIRSRCRVTRLMPLAPEDLTLALQQAGYVPPRTSQGAGSGAHDSAANIAALAHGSVGQAFALVAANAIEVYGTLMALLSRLPGQLDRQRLNLFATRHAELAPDLLERFLGRLAQFPFRDERVWRAAAEGERMLMQRLAPGPDAGHVWAEFAVTAQGRMQHGIEVNIDREALVLDTILSIAEQARSIRANQPAQQTAA